MTDQSKVMSMLIKKKMDLEENAKRSKGKEGRFTVVLSEYDDKRLSYIASKFGDPKSTLARELIIGALTEAEKVLGLDGWESVNERDIIISLDDDLNSAERKLLDKIEYKEYMTSPRDPLDEIE